MFEKYFQMGTDMIFGFIALFILTKILGKTQMSQLTAFDFISAVIIGELVGNALFDDKAGIPEIAFVVLLWGLLLYVVEFITQRFQGSRYFLEGKPSLMIHHGELIKEEMKKNKMTVEEVQQLMREKDVFSVQEVEYGILETDGKLSILKKPAYQQPTKQDLNVSQKPAFLPYALIEDGEVIEDNLIEAGLSKSWLLDELKKSGFNHIKDIFYCEYTEGKKLFVQSFTKKTERKKD
ncbi:UPF0702 transmembrane protein YetF [Lentibacillus sp. JNUCC-1]|uniref:DUF421 domain-containing protein n=1 Tax=Lentibacillus sp. JNUCC-1 TaxID=2654513 RepID=UPI00132AEFC2|nr:DUF421 domain-containing protein [Lentibacillus sp. JNUCC-1]MUV36499.1 UPF0702 transmembrane protein YetF [Lentibacillus sp. JNUCC-1]